jgi:hypothetical protein
MLRLLSGPAGHADAGALRDAARARIAAALGVP